LPYDSSWEEVSEFVDEAGKRISEFKRMVKYVIESSKARGDQATLDRRMWGSNARDLRSNKDMELTSEGLNLVPLR